MAGVKISNLPAATVPLTGTELIAVVQGGATKQAAIGGTIPAAQIINTPTGTIAATNVQTAINEIVTDLSASSGSSLVGFLQAGTGAVARTVQAKDRDIVSVKDFGAVGDGVTDDTAAIHLARDAAGVGGAILFPTGTYRTSAKLTPLQDQTWEFQNAIVKPIDAFPESNEIISIAATGVTLLYPIVDGNKASLTGTYANGAEATPFVVRAGGSHCRILFPTMYDSTNNGVVVYGSAVEDVEVIGGYALNNDITGFGVEIPLLGDTTPKNVRFTDCVAEACAYGFYIAGCDDAVLSGCRTKQSSNLAAFFYIGDAVGTLKNCKVIGCEFETANNGVSVIHVEGTVLSGANTGTAAECSISFHGVSAIGAGGGSGLLIKGGAIGEAHTFKSLNTTTAITTSGTGTVLKLFGGEGKQCKSSGISAGSRIIAHGYKLSNCGTGGANVALLQLAAGSSDSVFDSCTLGDANGETAARGVSTSVSTGILRIRITNSVFGDMLTPFNITTAQQLSWTIRDNLVSGAFNGKTPSRSTAAPTTGSWADGDVIYKTNPAAGGSSGWVCTTPGTFSTATEAGTTTSGSNIITGMADTSDFAVGDFVNASAGFAVLTALEIIGIVANTSITVSRAANASGAATIDTSDPVFGTMAVLT